MNLFPIFYIQPYTQKVSESCLFSLKSRKYLTIYTNHLFAMIIPRQNISSTKERKTDLVFDDSSTLRRSNFCICHGSRCIRRGAPTWRRHGERAEDEARTNTQGASDLKKNRSTKGAGGRRPPAPQFLVLRAHAGCVGGAGCPGGPGCPGRPGGSWGVLGDPGGPGGPGSHSTPTDSPR